MAQYNPPVFGIEPLENFVVSELKRRESNQGMDVSTIVTPSTYKGPLSAWARVCSNANVNGYDGIIMGGVYGFNDSYGANNGGNPVMGYDAANTPIRMPGTSIIYRPTPGLISIEISLVAATFRQAEIMWRCWSYEQLNFMEPYWLCPNLSVIIEWGWNNYNVSSLLNLNKSNIGTPVSFNNGVRTPATPGSIMAVWSDDWVIHDMMELSNGNYDVFMGVIKDFDYKQNVEGGFDCRTTIVSKSGLYTGLSSTLTTVTEDSIRKMNIKEWLIKFFPQVPNQEDNNTNPLYSDLNYLLKNPEDRIFASRGLTDQGTKSSLVQYQWDYNNNDFYVTMGFVVDLINRYLDSSIDNPNKTSIQIDDSYISAHPNLKSIDGSVLLIPNSHAPIWTNSQGILQTLNPATDGGGVGGNVDTTLQTVIGSSTRQDLNKIICARRQDQSTEFPDFSQCMGYGGKLKNLYVSYKAINDSFLGHETFFDGLMDLLNKMSAAACGIWAFTIKGFTRGGGGANDVLTIVDTNFIGFESAKDRYNDTSTYTFQFGQYNSIIKDFNFEVKLSESVALQIYYDAASQSGDGSSNSSKVQVALPEISDRIFPNGFVIQNTKQPPSISDSSDPDAQDSQTQATQKDYYLYTDVNSGKTYSLCEANHDLMPKLIEPHPDDPIFHAGPMPGTRLSLTLLGISGFRVMDYFKVSGLSDLYSNDCIFVVLNVKHKIENSEWLTIINAGVMKTSIPGNLNQ